MLARRTTPEVTRRIRAIGAKLRDRRHALGMTQRQLSDLTGVDQPAISHVELGDTIPMVSTLLFLCAGLRIDPGKVIRADFPVPERARRPRQNGPTVTHRVAPVRVLEPVGAD